MSYVFKYDQEYKRTIPAVIYDSRAVYANTKNLGGFELQFAAALHIAQAQEQGALPYKIITSEGNIAGYFVVATKNKGLIVRKIAEVLRPAFQQFASEIEILINGFITSGGFRPDLLL